MSESRRVSFSSIFSDTNTVVDLDSSANDSDSTLLELGTLGSSALH